MKMHPLELIVFIFGVFVSTTFAAEPNCAQPPPPANIQQCCNNQVFAELAPKCVSKIPAATAGMPRPVAMCFGECMFNETGLSVNGQIQLDKAKSILTEKFKAIPEFVAPFEQALTKCDKIIKERMASAKPPANMPPIPCNAMADIIASCTMLEAFINCPDSKWQNNEACNNAKQYFKSCPMPPPPKA